MLAEVIANNKTLTTIYLTDNGNYIVDLKLNYPCKDPIKENEIIKNIPGVIETGFFINLVGKVIVGYTDGHTEIY